MLTRVAGRTHDDSGPSIAEMRHELTRSPGRIEWYPLVSNARHCHKCGTEKADWWYVENGQTSCNRCVK